MPNWIEISLIVSEIWVIMIVVIGLEVDTLWMTSQVFNKLYSLIYTFPTPYRVYQGKRAAVVATALAGNARLARQTSPVCTEHGTVRQGPHMRGMQQAAGRLQHNALGGPIWIPFDAPGTLCHVWQTNINIVCRNRDRKVSLPQRHGLCQFLVWVAIRTGV